MVTVPVIFGRSRSQLVLGVIALFMVLLIAVTGAGATGLPKDVDEWMKVAALGPYQPDVIDWDSVYEAAKREGKVVIYTSSSRTIGLKDEFESLYPGITLEVYELGSTGSIEKLFREQLAQVYNADIIHASGYPEQLHMLYHSHMIVPFYPPELESAIPLEFRDPLTAQRYESRVVFYNSKVYPESPVTSWWDLTKPEWRGKVAFVDPMTDASTLDLITTIVLNADALAADYERVFGRPIRLTTPNAGYELLKGIINNRPRIFNRHTDLANVVGDPNSTNPPIGISIPFSTLRYAGDPARGNQQLRAITELTPAVGTLYPALMNIAFRAPHPNAAKLLMKYLYGDEEGGLGMAPFFIVGNWPARNDIPVLPQHPFVPDLSLPPLSELSFWILDPVGVWEKSAEVQEWWMINVQ